MLTKLKEAEKWAVSCEVSEGDHDGHLQGRPRCLTWAMVLCLYGDHFRERVAGVFVKYRIDLPNTLPALRRTPVYMGPRGPEVIYYCFVPRHSKDAQ